MSRLAEHGTPLPNDILRHWIDRLTGILIDRRVEERAKP